ncbi:Cu(I)/Ag(I) efflux system protein CusF [Roseovarius litoreus]|uniref:Cu(I)/Ag(I) efflux system protein CusF n=1 Tax=Roseovarius litoreus TaxID=1155722 RepID=A0A1M7KN66_9RHOB|nr:copper-binding protein [Roseovarius litoreus]SHM66737.1 Cu(I)/Ag(I) efflux system protein CusF [Roseovarius litoreus]
MRKFLLSLTIATAVPVFASASDDTMGHDMSSHGDMSSHEGMDGHEGMAGVHAAATVNSIGDGMANISHGPIAEIGWPAMTMDLPMMEGAEIEGVEAGDEVMMMLEKGEDGMYAIRALSPKE